MRELTNEEMMKTEGGIIPFLLGYAIGVCLGAGGTIAGYKLAKAYKEP